MMNENSARQLRLWLPVSGTLQMRFSRV